MESEWERAEHAGTPYSRTQAYNERDGITTRESRMPDLRDLYSENDEFTITDKDRNEYDTFLEGLSDEKNSDPEWMRRVYEQAVEEDLNYYVLEFSNLGGLVMPIILQITYADGEVEEMRIPAEIWRRNHRSVNKLIARAGDITEIVVDPYWETADADVDNNHYPRRFVPSRIELYKRERKERDLMADLRVERKTDTPDAEGAPEDEGERAVPMTESN